MLVAYFSPLAPAVILLLGAFILLLGLAWVPARRQSSPELPYLVASGVVELAILALFGIRLALGGASTGQGLELLSGWSFAGAEIVAALNVRADELSLPYLIVTLLLLLIVTLAAPSFMSRLEHGKDVSTWLAIGAAACLVYVSANGLTLSYAIFVFDAVALFYWLKQGQYNLAVARLLLGLFTAGALALATLTPASNTISGLFLLGLALWLRLGLYPYVEANASTPWPGYSFLPYLSLSLLVAVYLAIRISTGPPPGLIVWLVVILMLLNGLQTWLAGAYRVEQSRPEVSAPAKEQRPALLVPLILTEVLLILLTLPLGPIPVTACIIGLVLSLVALWITPYLGPPHLAERAWLWPYLPALTATATIIGLPFFLNWPVQMAIYGALFSSMSIGLIVVVLLAEMLALSGLVRYWLLMWHGSEKDGRRSGVAIVAMVPFLIPGLAPLILSAITRSELAGADFNQPNYVIIALAASAVGGAVLGYFSGQISAWLKLSPPAVVDSLRLNWLWLGGARFLNALGMTILRVQVVVEGQHYLGWMLFIALIGALIVLLTYS